MSWKPNQHEVAAMTSADVERRYEYFIKRVCDSECLWGLYSDAWAVMGDSSGRKLLPLWPHEDYAKLFATESWSSYAPKKIELDAFLEKWIPGMRNDGVKAGVFPVVSGKGIDVSLDDLEANLRHELNESYGEQRKIPA